MKTWYSVGKLRYARPNVHHFCFPIITGIMLPNIFYFCVAGSKDRYVCVDAHIGSKLAFRRWKFWHSRRYGKSFQHINSLLYPTSCKNINLACSVQTQGNLLFAELINAWKIISSGSNRNDLPQFSIPYISTLQNLPLPRASKFLKASAKT